MGGRGLGWSVSGQGEFGVSSEHGKGRLGFVKMRGIYRIYDEG